MERAPERTVYFAVDEASRRVKIGISADPAKRLTQLETPTELDIVRTEPGGRLREIALHGGFASLRVRGEWFALAGEGSRRLRDYIAGVAGDEVFEPPPSCPVNGAPVPPTKSNRGRDYCSAECKGLANAMALLERCLGGVEWIADAPRREYRRRLMSLANGLWRSQDTPRAENGRFR